MKAFIFVLIAILAIPLTIASTPDFSLVNGMNDTLKLGEPNHGYVIVTKQPYISTILTATTYINATLKRFDKFIWNNQDTIELWNNPNTKTTIINGGSFYFSENGVYTYQSISNHSKLGYISVNSESPLIINYTYSLIRYDEGIPTEILSKKDTLQTISTEFKIPITFNITTAMQPRNYVIKTTVKSSNKTSSMNETVTLKESRKWEVTDDSLTQDITLNSGDIKNLGKLYLKNIGNLDFDIETFINGNASDFIYTPKNITLLKGVLTPLPFIIQVPVQQREGNYSAKLTLGSSNLTRRYNLSIKVRDGVMPELVNISWSESRLYKENKIKLTSKDNIDVIRVNLSYYPPDNETSNQLQNKIIIPMEKDNWLFTGSYNFKEVGIAWFKACLYDSSNNEVCKWYNRTFSKIDLIKNANQSKMPTIKAGMVSSKIIFNVTETAPDTIKVTLKRFSTDLINDTTKYDIRLKDQYNNIYSFEGINSSVNVGVGSTYALEIKGEKVLKYDGILTFDQKPYRLTASDIHFEGQFRDYVPPHDYKLKWYGKEIECKANDTGNYDTSSSRCIIDFPADVSEESVTMPITATEVKLQNEKWNTTFLNQEKKISSRNYWISGMAAVCVLCFLILGDTLAFRPYRRVLKR